MKNIIIIVLVVLFNLIANSQSKFKIGVNYNLASSTYYGNKMSSMDMKGSEMPVYAMKISNGMGVKILYSINDKWCITFNTGYQQRGAFFDKGKYAYTPTFKFNYLDAMLGLAYQTKELIKKSKLSFNISGGYNRLLNSERVNNYESFNIVNDSQTNDFSALASVGLNIPRVEKDIIQLAVFANMGFKNVFAGVLEENGLVGKNLIFGIQLGYLFGISKNNK